MFKLLIISVMSCSVLLAAPNQNANSNAAANASSNSNGNSSSNFTLSEDNSVVSSTKICDDGSNGFEFTISNPNTDKTVFYDSCLGGSLQVIEPE